MRTLSIRSFMRLTERSSVLLPQPEGPISAVTLPRGTGRLMSKRACFSPYQRLKSLTSRTASSARTSGWTSAGMTRPAAMAASRSEGGENSRSSGGSFCGISVMVASRAVRTWTR